ncbi:MAG: hypothetical protein CME63_05455 [Halobacteriovoraceae bacterium]|nr:hypothetical protein [Halobacteriovoraceae bacterium]|tara:strand:+ start:111647 stop:112633 length:987 start_codon:yes stop_codon:yes gene_type:complete
MFIKRLFYQQEGSSYIQIILASTAIAGLALVGLKLASEQKELAKDIYGKYLVNYLHQEISYFLAQDKNCRESLIGKGIAKGEITSLKTPSRKDSFFPVREKIQENEVVFFEEPVTVKRYELKNRIDGKDAQLEITYALKDVVIQKKIPLDIQWDQNQSIVDCQVVADFSLNQSQGPWVLENETLKTRFETLHIGDAKLEGEGVVLEKGIYLEPESDLTQCSSDMTGVIKNIRGKGIRYCKNGAWYPFGQQRLRTDHMNSYTLGITRAGAKVIKTNKHRHCFISRLKKDLISDGCEIRRLGDNVMEEFEVRAFTSDSATSMECEVSCVD